MIEEENDAEVGESKMTRQLCRNDKIPLQLSLQETLVKFRDPASLSTEESKDELAGYRDERPLTLMHLSQTPMVFGLMQCKQDDMEEMRRDTVSAINNPHYQSRNIMHQNTSGRLIGSMSRVDARETAAHASRAQRKWDKLVQQQQDIRPL
jgi:hypothetical protein